MVDLNELEKEFFRVEAGENPYGARARAYVEELKTTKTGDRITPVERAALEYLAQYAKDEVTRPSVEALSMYLDIALPSTFDVLSSLIFKGVLRPRMRLATWREVDQHEYVFVALEDLAA